jgi:hypothetical protein
MILHDNSSVDFGPGILFPASLFSLNAVAVAAVVTAAADIAVAVGLALFLWRSLSTLLNTVLSWLQCH